MYIWRRKGLLLGFCTAALILTASPITMASQFQSSSSNYGVNEVFFGSGGNLSECSTNYCAKASAGEQAVGNPSSNNYQLHAGFTTTDKPVLEFAVNNGTVNLGTLNTGAVSTGSTTFSVLDYVSSGYTVLLTGSPPSTPTGGSSHVLTAMSGAGSSPGSEQFGINLVSNTTPSVGANPQQVPSSAFGFGSAASGYNTSNQFKFSAGNIVASSSQASGETLYTMSVIANISNATPGGAYSGTVGLVVVGTF